MKRIREERLRIGLLQKDVAQIISMDRTTYAKYETGAIMPPVEILVRLADLFNVSVDYLIERDINSDQNETDTGSNEIVDLYNRLNEDGKETAMNTLRALAAYPDMTAETKHAV